jgi:DNA-binding transcriptional LysR family regulator
MNYNYLRYFSVLAQVEHYTLAAARLGISQPSLSSAINHLEDELGGIKLFEKVGRNIRLTEEGRFYQEKVDAALHELNSASMTLRNSKVSAPVVVHMGVVSGALDGVVASELAAYIRQNERIRLRLTESSAEELMDLVRQEKLDMAIVDTTNRDRSLHFRKLGQRDFCVALPADHPLADCEALLPQQIAKEPQVVFNYDMEKSFSHWAIGDAGDERVICTVNTAQLALELVAAGVGICVVPNECVQERDDICFVSLKTWHQALYMCILYDKWLEPPIWDLEETLIKVIRRQTQI